MMDRRVKAVIANYIIRPPLLAIGLVVRVLYWAIYGWWGHMRHQAKQQRDLAEEIREGFPFLFVHSKAKIVPNANIGHLAALRCPIVTVESDGLLLRFVRWRDNRQVHIASELLPNQWQGLSEVLNVMDPDNSRDHSIMVFQDAARILKRDWDLVKEAFSPARYPEVKEQLEQEHRCAMAVSNMALKEMNRRLYPDK